MKRYVELLRCRCGTDFFPRFDWQSSCAPCQQVDQRAADDMPADAFDVPDRKAYQARYYQAKKAQIYAKRTDRMKSARERLDDTYVVALLSSNLKVSVGSLPPDLIALKREQLETRRLAQTLRKAIHEARKDPD